MLRAISTLWYVVIPATALLVGAVGAAIGALLGGLLAVAYNRSRRHALVVVELPEAVLEHHPGPAEGNGDPQADGRSTDSADTSGTEPPTPPAPGDPAPRTAASVTSVIDSAPRGEDREE